jgi:phosphatidylserine/phosphatidylglycerophosphate/cardiolipin synthase-like enzyme
MFRRFMEERLRKGPILKKLREQMFRASTKIIDATGLDVSLRSDIEGCKNHIIIFSPFLNLTRVKLFLSTPKGIVDALKRGVRVVVVTRPAVKKWVGDPDEHRECIKALMEAGIKVMEIEALHFKAVIIDDEIIYLGSINILSLLPIEYYPPDYMVRFESEALTDEIIENVIGRKKYEEIIG